MYPTIKIIVKGGVVCDVDNLPDGFQYEVIDHDVQENKKEYTFWKIIKKEVREECCIKANSLDEATEIHNRDGADYKEVHCFDDEIIDEGTDES